MITDPTHIHCVSFSAQYESEGEGEVRVKTKRVPKEKKKNIYDVYEPSELEAGHMTERDAEIRVTDIPERFQVHYTGGRGFGKVVRKGRLFGGALGRRWGGEGCLEGLWGGGGEGKAVWRGLICCICS